MCLLYTFTKFIPIAAHEWDDAAEAMRVKPSEEGTYENLFHKAGGGEDFGLRFRANTGGHGLTTKEASLVSAMNDCNMLERAIGVVSIHPI